MPILGIVASSLSGNLYSASYDSIATVSVDAGGASSVVFSSIPQTYKHLQVRILARSTSVSSQMYIVQRMNGIGGNSYTQHGIYADGSTVTGNGAANDVAVIQRFTGGGAAADIFGAAIIDYVDYTNANKKPVMRSLGGVDLNGTGVVGFYSTMIQTNGAITELSFIPSSSNFAQYSSFALYGIKDVA